MNEKELKDFALFGKRVIGIISTFSTTNDEKIKEIINILDKYPSVCRDYDANIGMFS